MSLYRELKRRNVFRVAIAYLALAWLVTEVAGTLFPAFGIPDWSVRFIVIVFALGFVPALIISWVYELTPEGLKRETEVVREQSITHLTAKRLDVFTIGVVVVALAFILADRLWLSPQLAEQSASPAEIVTEAVQTPESAPPYPPNSIAVLAFTDLSPEGDQEYFSDGISEELLNLLAQIPELRVISRSSAFSFKGKDIAIPAVAKQLNVAHVLEGSVRKTGNRVRITAQLIETRSDSHLWSETYDRELDDIFAVQDEIAGAIIDALKVKLVLVAGEPAKPKAIKAANTDAYDVYLRGRELIRLRGRQNLEEAVRHLERALRLDETFAPAHAQLAIATALLERSSAAYGRLSREEVLRIALPHLDRAQELEPDLAEAHAGRVLLADDPEAAIEHARKALAVNPSYSDAMYWLYLALKNLGRYEEASATLMQMLVTDPLNIVGRHAYALWLARRGRVEEAHEMADQLLLQSPWGGYTKHAQISVGWEGKITEGLSWALRAHAEDPSTYIFSEYRVLGFIWVGEYDEARRIDDELAYVVDVAEGRFDDAIQATQKRMQLDPYNVEAIAPAANVLYAAGRIDEALSLYERLRNFVPEGRPIPKINKIDFLGGWMTMRLALARRQAGDEEGAQAAAQIVRQDQAARRAAGRKDQREHRTEAMLAAFEHNPDRVIAALKSAIQLGLGDPQVFDDPIFEDLWDEPRFIALQQELDAILAMEHGKVLRLICFNNPTPDNWQPLPETCEGVVNQQN
jgi:TolB-like protein/Flp pilus assembly protein TadD